MGAKRVYTRTINHPAPQPKGITVNIVRFAIAAALAAAVGLAPALAAQADDVPAPTASETCLANHPDAVAFDAVTPGDDLVCVERTLIPSEGDDTYLWVGADVDPRVVLSGPPPPRLGEILPDPGTDTLSLADWSVPLVDVYAENGWGGLFGIRIVNIDDPEVIRYTDHDDVIGDPNLCERMTNPVDGVVDIAHYTGLGADTVQCVLGSIYTEGGDDTILGVTDGAAVFAGAGDDTVSGDGTADVINLGIGNDTALVRDGGIDIVDGGLGVDTVVASHDDILSNVEVALLPAKATAPPKSPTKSKPKCVKHKYNHGHAKHHKGQPKRKWSKHSHHRHHKHHGHRHC